MIASTIEQQRADLGKALKDYADIISVISQLREQEAKKEDMRKGFENKNILDE